MLLIDARLMRPQFPFPSSLAYPSQVAHSIDGVVRIFRASTNAGESHTFEVLVARCLPGGPEIIEHQTTMVRLGESVNESGEISRDKLDAARQYKELAQQHGAE